MRFSTQFSTQWTVPVTATFFCLSIFVPRWSPVSTAHAQTPATQAAATQPAPLRVKEEFPLNSPARRWFDQLADPDPKVRERARIELMGISSDNLPRLRQLVIDHSPDLSLRAVALHDIVMQVFLADEKYVVIGGESTAHGDQGPFFIGVTWKPDAVVEYRLGVVLETLLPGFPSFRFLRKSDMILGVFFDPTQPLGQLPNKETHFVEELTETIQSHPEAQDIVLLVLRDGQEIRVPIHMAPRPFLPRNEITEFAAIRAQKAEDYWQENFAPLVPERYAGLIED